MLAEELLEELRVQSLCALGILDTGEESRFDRYTRLAAAAFGVPVALVSLVDAERQWFKSRHGFSASELPKADTLCRDVIAAGATIVIPDTRLDARFMASALASEVAAIRFYAGHPIRTLDGYAVGTLCIIDSQPRQFDLQQQRMLTDLALMVEDEMNKPRLTEERQLAESSLRQLNADLEAKNEALSREIRQRREIEQSMRESEERLRTVTENLPTLIGLVNREGNFVFLNTRTLRFYGQSAEELIGYPVVKAYSAEEYQRVGPHIEAALAGRKSSFEGERTVDGRRRFYHASYVPNLDDEGKPNGFVAMAFDITSRRESEMRQAESEERLRTITNNLPVLIAYLDRDCRFHFANDMHRDWTGMRSEDMMGRTLAEVFGPAYVDERALVLQRCLGGHMSHIELPVVHRGHARMLSSTYIPHVRDGQVLGMYVLSSDSTAAHEYGRQLLELANTDPLTGLPNRRSYEERLAAALARSRRQRCGVALMYLDVDHFKQVNDSLGHAAGDEVLQEFGRRVKSAVRETDTVARLAGDEFTVILEFVQSAAQCELVAGKILEAVRPLFHAAGRGLRVSTSIGIAFCEGGSTAAMLGREADAALYQAKQAGKDCYRVRSSAPRHQMGVVAG